MSYEVRYPVKDFVERLCKLMNLLPWGEVMVVKEGSGVWGDFRGYNLHAVPTNVGSVIGRRLGMPDSPSQPH